MQQPSLVPGPNPLPPTSSVSWLHSLLRFARVIRFRWPLVVTVLIAAMLFGVLYYGTADRVYQARAQLLVQQM